MEGMRKRKRGESEEEAAGGKKPAVAAPAAGDADYRTGSRDGGDLRYVVAIAYDGGAFRGFQKQNAAQEAVCSSVSHAVEKAVAGATGARGDEVRVGPYSRTDAGTHARYNACLVSLTRAFAERIGGGRLDVAGMDTLMATAALNDAVESPSALRVLHAARVPAGTFIHGIRPKAKRYCYTIIHRPEAMTEEAASALAADLDPYSYAVKLRQRYMPMATLKVQEMAACVAMLVGRNDFREYQKPPAKGAVFREVFSARLLPVARSEAAYVLPASEPPTTFEAAFIDKVIDPAAVRAEHAAAADAAGDFAAALAAAPILCFEIAGTGFLRCMVRKLAYAIMDVGRGDMAVEDFAATLKGRHAVRWCAPAKALVLDAMWWGVQGRSAEEEAAAAELDDPE
eukprot:TRINITY_DN33306_c0_g1_i1.p1 TRINITY_DN33306_c0_g1~~TRINITY_DN33306_c0_g1_i1.p1  ORF type:complete len:416 (+),score=144.78 TRINITY_DN33306_c0_g1_i1:57-1250(+)